MNRPSCGELHIIVAFGVIVSCGPTMHEHCLAKGSLLQYLASSPAIVVGLITKVDELSWIHRSKCGSQHVQLCRVEAKVENVLQGQAGSNEIMVYYFTIRGSLGGISGMAFAPGDRYIFYLRREAGAGEWRTACDDYGSCVDPVLTGGHASFKRSSDRPVSEDILEILNTRGEGVTDGKMVNALESLSNAGVRWRYNQEEAFTKLLEHTARVETPPVRAEACVLLKAMASFASKARTNHN